MIYKGNRKIPVILRQRNFISHEGPPVDQAAFTSVALSSVASRDLQTRQDLCRYSDWSATAVQARDRLRHDPEGVKWAAQVCDWPRRDPEGVKGVALRGKTVIIDSYGGRVSTR